MQTSLHHQIFNRSSASDPAIANTVWIFDQLVGCKELEPNIFPTKILLCRYAPATQLWRGRLHVMGGSKEDRHEPGLEHWSLAVKDGKALEKE
jgi:hypothetical protein